MDIKKCLRSCFCDCVCVRWPCWNHWRMWCKPLMIIVYLMVIFVVLPLLSYEMYRKHADPHVRTWFVAGIFMLLTFPINYFFLDSCNTCSTTLNLSYRSTS